MKALTFQNTELVRLMRNPWMQRTLQATNLLLVIWIIWLLYILTRNFLSPTVPPDIVPVDTEARPVVKANPANELISQLPRWHLYGMIEQKQAEPVEPTMPEEVPETRLNLFLRGVFTSSEMTLARAIITDQSSKEEMYAIGDSLTDNAELREIHPDRVILLREGQYETLLLPREEIAGLVRQATSGSQAITPRSTNAGRESSTHKSPNKTLDTGDPISMRQKWKRRQKTLPWLVDIKPKKNDRGEDIGFQLYPGGDHDWFESVGLREGDEVVEIDGITMDTPSNVWQALNSAKRDVPVQMSILRGDQEMKISFKLPQ